MASFVEGPDGNFLEDVFQRDWESTSALSSLYSSINFNNLMEKASKNAVDMKDLRMVLIKHKLGGLSTDALKKAIEKDSTP